MAEQYNSLSDLLEEQNEPFPFSDSSAFNSIDTPDVDGGNPTTLNVTIGEEFERSRPPSSLSRRLANMAPPIVPIQPSFDYRALEYVPDYDPRLECPICHVPLLDPIRLPCDHIFCSSCFEIYQSSGSGPSRRCCPSCRADIPRKGPYAQKDVPRLIVNMCNDIQTHCPNYQQGCPEIRARELIALHAAQCDFEPVKCPLSSCSKLTRKRDIDSKRCRHKLVVCRGCGAEFMDQDLSIHKAGCIASTCCHCGSWQFHEGATLEDHEAMCLEMPRKCSGESLGCSVSLKEAGLKIHEQTCPFVVLGPYLKQSAGKMGMLESNLAVQKDRNERLEATCKRLWDIMKIHIVPTIDELRRSSNPAQPVALSPTGVSQPSTHYPSPSTTINSTAQPQPNLLAAPSSSTRPSPVADPLTHLLSLHEFLRTDVSSMNTRIESITSSLDNFMAAYTESESRANMMLLNDVLRIKEDLAHTNAALFSLRAQVGWLSRMNGMGANLATGIGRHVEGGTNMQSPAANAPGNRNDNTDAGASVSANAGELSTGAGGSDGDVGRRPSDRQNSQERVKL